MKEKFYAVVDDEGICSIDDDRFSGAKAIFDNIQDAESVIKKHPDKPLSIEEVAIIEY